MDSNIAFPSATTSKSSVDHVYDNFPQALSLRPSAMGVPREMDERHLFLMSQMHAPWARPNFTEGASSAEQPSVSSQMYTSHNNSVFHTTVPSTNLCQPVSLQSADLPIPFHQRQQFQQVPEQSGAPKVASSSNIAEVFQSAEESLETPSSERKQPAPRKRKRAPADKEQTVLSKQKRIANPQEWKKKKKKLQRDKGEEYVTDGGKVQKAKNVQPIDCSKCRFRCSEKIPEDVRKAIHKVYWNLASYERQRAFIAQHVEQNDIKQVKSKTSARREVAHSFFFVHKRKEHRVCKSFFTKTLDISNKLVDYTMKKTECGVYVGQDERGRRDPVNKTRPEDSEFVRWHINSFPTVVSGKGKTSKNRKLYLSQDLNVGKMYLMYKELCEQSGRKPAGISVYRSTFKQDFNLSFMKAKKEHCVNCKCGDGYKKKKKDTCSGNNAASIPGSSSVTEQPVYFNS